MDDDNVHDTHTYTFLTKGSDVEVTSDDDHTYYSATVIHHHNKLVYLEYHNLFSSSTTRLREYADTAYVRPKPHFSTTSPSTYNLNDVVDAFHNDGWCTGVVTDVIDEFNYIVTFLNRSNCDQVRVNCEQLRVHRRWVNGRWFQPQKQGTAGLLFTVGKKVEVSFERENARDCWLPATILKNTDNNTFLVEYQQPGSGDEAVLHKATVDYLHIRPTPPPLRVKSFVLLEKVDAYYDFGWWSGVVTKELADNRYNVFFKHTKQEREFVCSRVRPHMEWKGGKWFNASQGDMDGRTPPSLIEQQIEQTTPNTDKQSTIATSRMKRARQKKIDSNDNGAPSSKKPHDEIMNDDSSKKTNGSSVGKSEGINSEVTGMAGQAVGKSENLSSGKKVGSKLTTDSPRKRGKLTNELRSLQACDTAKVDSTPKSITEEIVEEIQEEDDIDEDSIVPVVVGLQCNGMSVSQGNILQKLSIEKTPNVTESDTQPPSVPLSPLTVAEKQGSEVDTASVAPKRKRGRPPKLRPSSPTTPATVNNQNGDVVPSVVEDGQKKEENQGPVKEQPTSGIQKAPLSKDKLPNKSTDGQPSQGTKKYSARKGKRGKRRTISVNTESPAQDIVATNDDEPISILFEAKHSPTYHGPGTADERLALGVPVARTTPLWETVESMEAFRMLPQKPHFRPLLEGVKESAREGLAIGTMVTFSILVNKTLGLRFDEPRSRIEDFLETLVELENNGFDVKVIRDRLTRLLLFKDKQDELVERSKGVAEKIEEHSEQPFDEEIKAIDRQIKELEAKRKQVVLKKKKFDSEIGVMEALSEEIEEEMKRVGAEFDKLAAAPL
ncbi:DUF724 domain-containing protein 7-like isoform X3 [Bidens hawaiensis]|uniref:DUF724 domain-containing protein 7-like isoform X3 n=1 Tax=Bidens hawaiensis TaxID=980011 RepID=UPI00404A3D8A